MLVDYIYDHVDEKIKRQIITKDSGKPYLTMTKDITQFNPKPETGLPTGAKITSDQVTEKWLLALEMYLRERPKRDGGNLEQNTLN